MQIKFAALNGIRTRYLIAGSGAPIVLVHGIGLSFECWIHNVEPLSRRYTVIAPDLLGHGFTDAVNFGREASQLVNARHITALTESLGFTSFDVVGSSFGGLVSALIYFNNPGRVRKLTLACSASTFQSEASQAAALRAAVANGTQAMANPTLESCRRRIQHIVYDPSIVPDALLWPQLTSYALPDRLAAYEATIETCLANLADPSSQVAWRLAALKVPSWVLAGRNDPRADWRQHSEGVKMMSDARLSVYENCGHLPFLEHPDKFNSDLIEFLGH
ncbi:MAG: alpha/beta fold hydrolase [Betaproteobacteria bacterium]|nr:alpha/beta fold hydrolase [Betaproteobacteria bacterium]